MFVVFLQTAPAPLPSGYGAALVQTLVSLLAVSLLAWLILRWGARRGFALGGRGKHVKVVERVPLDPRRTLYVIEVGGKVLLLGAGDGASPTLLTELTPASIDTATSPASPSFADVLSKLRGKSPSPPEGPVESNDPQ